MNSSLSVKPCLPEISDQIGLTKSAPGLFSKLDNRAKEPTPHFMLVPSLTCPAGCSYCFGPHQGPVMSPETMEAVLNFMADIVTETTQDKVHVTFHGGEPLASGHRLWQHALEGIARRFTAKRRKIALQSNLWLLDDRFCQLFQEHTVEIGTSLDGPEDINDAQRGQGYFARTMEGIKKARGWGLNVGCIATFTPQSAQRWREVFDFFLAERIGFSIHAAVPSLHHASIHAITPAEYGELLREMFDYYVEHRHELAVSTLDQMCQSVVRGDGKVCTFRDCLGMFLALDPYGDIYPCQRFCGNPEYRFCALSENPTFEKIMQSPVARIIAARQNNAAKACAGCSHMEYCRGGCIYNAWVSHKRTEDRDPYCEAYRGVFNYILSRLLEEMASEENITAIVDRPYDGRSHFLLRKGPIIELSRGETHPSHTARVAKRIIAAVELARGPDVPSVAARLVAMGIARTQESGEKSLHALHERLFPKIRILNNLYVHLTFRCQLECTHCYAGADARGNQQPDMPVDMLAHIVRQAKEAGFRQVILTGGEPLIHTERGALLSMLHEIRSWARPMNLVLRTNLAIALTREDLAAIANAVDQVVVSVDGNEQTHDTRRGTGSYAAVMRNLETYGSLAFGNEKGEYSADLSLACVMPAADIQGPPGQSVRELAHRLGIRRTRFRPLLPLGRAKDWKEPPTSEALGAHVDPMELIENDFQPVSSCGMGQNLYVEPSGQSFPCYAYHRSHSYLGNVIEDGLQAVLDSPAFVNLSGHNVDTNPKCKTCDVRYLCGGACRAWGGDSAQYDLDIAPVECEGLRRRAMGLLNAAEHYLDLKRDGGTKYDDVAEFIL